jgi:DNA-binding LytR/AlgR family response regulator
VNTKLRCILLDDELPGLTYLKMLCEQLPELEILKAYSSPKKFLQEVETFDFDLCILDIEMPEVNGLQVATLLKDKLVIFTTAYKEYAAEAFDINAIDYIRKPIQKERLQQAVSKAGNVFNSKKDSQRFVQFNTDKGKALIHFNQLAYITTSDTDSRDKIAVLQDGSSMTLKNVSFETLSGVLPESQFCRINKREMISLKIVLSYTYNEITTSMINDQNKQKKFSLSEVYRPAFLNFSKPVL